MGSRLALLARAIEGEAAQVTLEELRQLRESNPGAYRRDPSVKRVVVDNDKPSSPGVWQGGGTRSVELGIVIGTANGTVTSLDDDA